MEIEVLVVGYGNAASRPALLSTEHSLSAYGCPVVLVEGRARLPIDAVLEGWHVFANGHEAEEAVQRWRAAVALFGRYPKDRPLAPCGDRTAQGRPRP